MSYKCIIKLPYNLYTVYSNDLGKHMPHLQKQRQIDAESHKRVNMDPKRSDPTWFARVSTRASNGHSVTLTNAPSNFLLLFCLTFLLLFTFAMSPG